MPSGPDDTSAHPVPRRPALKAGLRRLWRDTASLQLGVAPPHAVILDGVTEDHRRFVDSLDGTRPRSGVPDPWQLLGRLASHDVLDDASAGSAALRAAGKPVRERLAPDLASWALRGSAGHAVATFDRRTAATVEVRGAGRVGALVAVLLTSAGVGAVDVVDPRPLRAGDAPAPLPDPPSEPDSAGPTRAEAARRWCDSLGLTPSAKQRRGRRRSTRRAGPDVVVLAPAATCGAVDPAEHGRLLQDDVPHLLAYVRETAGVVGPFVLPGRGPCLRCVELARTDRDRMWPRLLAQLVASAYAGRGEPVDACDGVLATLVAAHAALEVLAQLDGRTPSTWATAHEISADDPVVRLRSWVQHPACGCGWGSDD